MGFFSWECPECGHSIRFYGACRGASRWLSQAVVIRRTGTIVRGSYDGYGRVDGYEIRDLKACIYHARCYHLAGSPGYTGLSNTARDQGFFVGEYDPPEPVTRKDVQALARYAKEQQEAADSAYQAARAKRRAEMQAEGKTIPDWLAE
jgi:hypothetical protein